MKKLFLITVLSVLAISCNNDTKTEAVEEQKRDSIDNVQKSADEKLVEEMEARDDSARRAQEAMAKDSVAWPKGAETLQNEKKNH